MYQSFMNRKEVIAIVEDSFDVEVERIEDDLVFLAYVPIDVGDLIAFINNEPVLTTLHLKQLLTRELGGSGHSLFNEQHQWQGILHVDA